MFDHLKELLGHGQPRFVCVAAGASAEGRDFTTPLDHEASLPLDDDSMTELVAIVGDLPATIAFYKTWGSLRLFRGLHERPGIGRASAYYIAPPAVWGELRESVDDWWSGLDADQARDILPEWAANCVAVGEIPNSGNYFLMPLAGPDRGKVFEFDHDGFEFIERGADFEDFVNRLASTQAGHLQRISGHTRYSDGQTPTQWMPVRYLHGDS